ncbi:hypothetical protein DFH11DRAFT_1564031 [Phellopilus nigrolimitatus]|nr:hypothetical protein DFH11DRAFT_1564031 [Phellopilus nigrolimitatus]
MAGPPHPQYLLAPHPQHAHIPGAVHLVSAQMRAEQTQRKRPKYTRSKTGCLTCRAKKIKCDETRPKCQRCGSGQRECTWPDPAPAKKKTPARKSSALEERASTDDSASRVSDSSSTSRDVTPSTRDLSAGVSAASVSEPERRYRDEQAYSFGNADVPANRRQAGSHSQIPPMSSLNSAAKLPPSYPSSAPSYNIGYSPNGSISSRSDSRPSTANSIPSSRFSGSGLDSGHYDGSPDLSGLEPREYPRWETLPPPRPGSHAYSYHPSQESDIMSRHYSHEHVTRI